MSEITFERAKELLYSYLRDLDAEALSGVLHDIKEKFEPAVLKGLPEEQRTQLCRFINTLKNKIIQDERYSGLVQQADQLIKILK